MLQNPEEALAALVAEGEAFSLEPAEHSEKILKENVPLAALTLVDLMRTGSDEKVRYNAATQIMDRVLGKPKTQITVPGVNPLERFLDGIEDAANSGAGN